MNKSTAAKLDAYERRYRDLASAFANIGYIASGSVVLRHTRCGTANCSCHAEPPRLHGPYWQWTAKVAGKTVNKGLSEHEARLYAEWIANDRKARSLLEEMRAVAVKATTLILADEAD